ncbi:hypothetical protein [Phormidesmis priestleyi]|uniref:hypothetical protein n=1 Tax=Phormidesmis priestleyi TaxID=268141 RepID=UPI00083A0AD5|nr:hypothetical protein [Phormidesmis priestleyi]
MMKLNFPAQIDYLLFSGDIEGDEILSLHHLLKSYEQGLITAEEMQEAIHSFNTDMFLLEPPIDELSME